MPVLAYLVLGVLMLGLAIAAALMGAGARRFRTARRLSTLHEYGFASEPSVQSYLPESPRRSPLAELANRIGEILSRRIGSVGEEEIREQLMSAGMYTVSPRTLLGYRILATLGLPAVVFGLIGVHQPMDLLMVVCALFAGWTLPLTYVRRRARKRLNEIDRSLPDLIDLLCVMVEAGLSFGAAMRLAAGQFVPPLSDELRLTLQEQTMGLGIDEALGNLAERADTPAVRAFVRAMAQGERMGISTGQIMRNLSHEMRQRRRSRAEEKAQKAPVLMLFPLVLMIFPAMFIILMTPAVINLMHSFKGF
jgi:tight adherence protein C